MKKCMLDAECSAGFAPARALRCHIVVSTPGVAKHRDFEKRPVSFTPRAPQEHPPLFTEILSMVVDRRL